MDGLLYTSPPPPPPQKKEGEETGGRKERKQGRAEKEDKEEGKTSEGKRKGGMIICQQWGFPIKPVGKESACSAGDPGSIPGLGRSPGEGKSCLTLHDPMDYRMPGFPIPHHLLKFTQVRIHLIGDAIQPSHPLSPFYTSVSNFS